MTDAINIRHLNKWYGKYHALKDINLDIAKGERLVICGPSGSGKSTLIRCINRLESYQEGEIRIDGEVLNGSVRQTRDLRRKVGMVFQQFNLFPHLTILENLTLGPVWVNQQPRAQAEAVARQYLRTNTPASFPADNSSALPSPARCAWTAKCCYSTNRPRRWTRR